MTTGASVDCGDDTKKVGCHSNWLSVRLWWWYYL